LSKGRGKKAIGTPRKKGGESLGEREELLGQLRRGKTFFKSSEEKERSPGLSRVTSEERKSRSKREGPQNNANLGPGLGKKRGMINCRNERHVRAAAGA